MKKFLVFVILVLLLVVFRSPLLTGFAKLFRVDNATQGADVMIVLSGNIATRPRYAVELYNDGYANRVFLTVTKNWEGFASPYVEAQNNYAEFYMLKHQVPVEFLPSTHAEGAMSTLDEALDAVAFIKNNPQVLHVIILTDAFHTYRSLYMFRKVFKANGLGHIQLEAAAAPNEIFDETNWYTNEEGLVMYFQELIKTPMYWLGLANNPNIVAH